MGLVNSYGGLLAARWFLGVTEVMRRKLPLKAQFRSIADSSTLSPASSQVQLSS